MDSLNLEAERYVASQLAGETPIDIVRTSHDRDGEIGDGYLVLTPTRLLVGDRPMSGEMRWETWPLTRISSLNLEEQNPSRHVLRILGPGGPLGTLVCSTFERGRVAAALDQIEAARSGRAESPAAIPEARIVPRPPAAPPAAEPEIPMAVVLSDRPRRTTAKGGSKGLVVELDRAVCAPGDTVRGRMRLGWPSAGIVRGVWWEALGKEETHITVSHGSGKNRRSTTYRSRNFPLRTGQVLFGQRKEGFFGRMWEGLRALFGLKTDNPELPAGEYTYEFAFPIPHGAAPSYRGTHVDVTYDLSARVDIPGAFDLTASVPVQVRQHGTFVQSSVSGEHRPKTGLTGLFTADVEMQVDAPDCRFRAGDPLPFTVRVKNLGGKRVRGLNVYFVRREWARAQGYTRSTDHNLQAMQIPVERFSLDGEPVMLSVPSPADLVSYGSSISSVTWLLRVDLDIAWGVDASVEAPLNLSVEG